MRCLDRLKNQDLARLRASEEHILTNIFGADNMAIPMDVWLVFIFLAVLGTAVSWLWKDRNNYTDAICGILATLLWFVSGISCLIGIQTEVAVFTAGYGFWIFVVIGVIEGVITAVKILDIATSRKNTRYTTFEPLHL